MKQAVQLPQYSDTNQFTPPDGVEIQTIDKNSNLLANETCPDDFSAAFLEKDLDTHLAETELARIRATRRSGPSAENILRDLAGRS